MGFTRAFYNRDIAPLLGLEPDREGYDAQEEAWRDAYNAESASESIYKAIEGNVEHGGQLILAGSGFVIGSTAGPFGAIAGFLAGDTAYEAVHNFTHGYREGKEQP